MSFFYRNKIVTSDICGVLTVSGECTFLVHQTSISGLTGRVTMTLIQYERYQTNGARGNILIRTVWTALMSSLGPVGTECNRLIKNGQFNL